MPERFVQIVITKLPDGRFHTTLQSETMVVRSFDLALGETKGELCSAFERMDIPSQAKRFEQA